MRKITGTIKAYITDLQTSPDDLLSADASDALGRMVYYDEISVPNWIECGVAEITVTLFDNDKVKNNIIANLNFEKQKILANAHVAATKIEERIQSLLAIEDKSE